MTEDAGGSRDVALFDAATRAARQIYEGLCEDERRWCPLDHWYLHNLFFAVELPRNARWTGRDFPAYASVAAEEYERLRYADVPPPASGRRLRGGATSRDGVEEWRLPVAMTSWEEGKLERRSMHRWCLASEAPHAEMIGIVSLEGPALRVEIWHYVLRDCGGSDLKVEDLGLFGTADAGRRAVDARFANLVGPGPLGSPMSPPPDARETHARLRATLELTSCSTDR